MKKKIAKRGDDKYMEKDEVRDRKMMKKKAKAMKTAGLAKALQKSEKEMGYGKLVKVKPTKKV